MLLVSKQMRACTREVRRSLGSRSGSDSEDGDSGDQQAGWKVVFWQCQGRDCDARHGRRRHHEHQLLRQYPLHARRNEGCGHLRGFVSPNFGPAATHLLHLTALPVHGAAACAFLTTHRTSRDAGQHRSRCCEQKEDRNESGETTHDAVSIARDGSSGPIEEGRFVVAAAPSLRPTAGGPPQSMRVERSFEMVVVHEELFECLRRYCGGAACDARGLPCSMSAEATAR